MNVSKLKLEIFIPETHLAKLRQALQETLKAIREVHPYEEPVINVIPLYSDKGMGNS